MPEEKLKEWQCPPFEADPQRRQSWVEEQVQDGEKWWESQPAAESENFLKLLSSKGPQRLKSNSVKADIRKFVETISDIREIATYGGSEIYKGIIGTFNNVAKFVYQDSFYSHQTRESLQYGVALGRGYLWPRFMRTEFGWGPGKMDFASLGPREVCPSQVPRNNDVQGSYSVTIIECLGIAEAHARFPQAQEELSPLSKFKYSSNTQVRRHEFWDRWRYGEKQADWEKQYCEIRHTFIRDLRINRSGKMFPMGDSGTSWYYEVPSVGGLISWTNPDNGLPESKMASTEDCRVYPQLRQIITNPGMSKPLYDGPAFDWHGIMPPVQYDVDDWPWLAVGYSLLQDVAGVEVAGRDFVDLMYRVLRRKMKPIMGYDLNAGIPREDIKRLDILDSDELTIGIDGDPSKALKNVVPDFNITAEEFRMLDVFEKIRQKALGLNDIGSLAQLKFNVSADTADKLLETIGPVAKGIALNLQISASKVAEMLKYDIMQYFTTKDILSFVGPDGVSPIMFDYEPNSAVPSHFPWEKNKEEKSEFSRDKRARWFAKNLKVISVPNALLNVTQMQEQLKWLNFLQRGFPISFSTAFKKLGVENWGDTPGATEFEKWKHEQFSMLELKAKAAQLAAVEMPGAGEGSKGQGKGGGRPPSGKQPPKLEKRGNTTGNLRTVVSQSK